MSAVAAMLPGGRLHLQHGPIDLVIGADGARDAAFALARARFGTILEELAAELPLLRRPLADAAPAGAVARRMTDAVRPHAGFVTPMAAVAGAVADAVLATMVAAPATRAYVNNGGDIALHLTPGTRFTTAMAHHDGTPLGRIEIAHGDGIGGIATSGRHGRSLSLGIADSVTVLARDAAAADAAATLIANAVDLPGHPAIRRRPACEIDPDSDLGARRVTIDCGALSPRDAAGALDIGLAAARAMREAGLIVACAMALQGEIRTLGPHFTRSLEHA